MHESILTLSDALEARVADVGQIDQALLQDALDQVHANAALWGGLENVPQDEQISLLSTLTNLVVTIFPFGLGGELV